jgi:hypothetical protein
LPVAHREATIGKSFNQAMAMRDLNRSVVHLNINDPARP